MAFSSPLAVAGERACLSRQLIAPHTFGSASKSFVHTNCVLVAVSCSHLSIHSLRLVSSYCSKALRSFRIWGSLRNARTTVSSVPTFVLSCLKASVLLETPLVLRERRLFPFHVDHECRAAFDVDGQNSPTTACNRIVEKVPSSRFGPWRMSSIWSPSSKASRRVSSRVNVAQRRCMIPPILSLLLKLSPLFFDRVSSGAFRCSSCLRSSLLNTTVVDRYRTLLPLRCGFSIAPAGRDFCSFQLHWVCYVQVCNICVFQWLSCISDRLVHTSLGS